MVTFRVGPGMVSGRSAARVRALLKSSSTVVAIQAASKVVRNVSASRSPEPSRCTVTPWARARPATRRTAAASSSGAEHERTRTVKAPPSGPISTPRVEMPGSEKWAKASSPQGSGTASIPAISGSSSRARSSSCVGGRGRRRENVVAKRGSGGKRGERSQ
jgi:hypothetical protein